MNAITTSLTSTPSNPILEKLIEDLFDDMLLDFGKKFVDMWSAASPDRLVKHWAKELIGYTPREFKRGVEAQKQLDWPPTLNQFKKLCRPEIDHTTAYYEALAGIESRNRGEHGAWTHPAIYWSAMTLRFDLPMQTYSFMKARWESELNKQTMKGVWSEIPLPVKAIPAPGKSELSREKAKTMLDQLGASEILITRKEDTLWYRKILKRIKDGDKTVTMIQRNFAEAGAKAHGYTG